MRGSMENKKSLCKAQTLFVVDIKLWSVQYPPHSISNCVGFSRKFYTETFKSVQSIHSHCCSGERTVGERYSNNTQKLNRGTRLWASIKRKKA